MVLDTISLWAPSSERSRKRSESKTSRQSARLSLKTGQTVCTKLRQMIYWRQLAERESYGYLISGWIWS